MEPKQISIGDVWKVWISETDDELYLSYNGGDGTDRIHYFCYSTDRRSRDELCRLANFLNELEQMPRELTTEAEALVYFKAGDGDEI